MWSISRRTALVGVAGLAGCVRRAPVDEIGQTGEGQVDVPGGKVVWRRFGGGTGAPLLVVHGGPGATSAYLEPLRALGAERPVYFWDQLGCGRSERPSDPGLWNIPRFVEEMAAVRASLGLTRLHILGQSWGTCLTVDYLLAKGETDVLSVTLAGPVMSASRYMADVRPMLLELSAEHQAAIAAAEASADYASPDYAAATEAFYALHLMRQPTEEMRALWRRSLEGFGQESYVAMNGPSEFTIIGSLRTYEREAELARLSVPVLYLSGAFDTCTPAAARQYAAATPNAEVAVIPGAGHLTTLDAPDATNRAVRAFVHAHDA